MVESPLAADIRTRRYGRRHRLLYSTIGFSVFAVVILGLIVAMLTSQYRLDDTTALAGFVVGLLFTALSHVSMRRRAKTGVVVDGSVLIARKHSGRKILLLGIALGLSIFLAEWLIGELVGFWQMVSFFVGIFCALLLGLPVSTILLEAEFGKVYTLTS